MPKIRWRDGPARKKVKRYPRMDELTQIPPKRKKLEKYPYTGKVGTRRPRLEEFFDERIQAEEQRNIWNKELAGRDKSDYGELSVETLKFTLARDKKNLEFEIKNKRIPSDIRWIVLLKERINLIENELKKREGH